VAMLQRGMRVKLQLHNASFINAGSNANLTVQGPLVLSAEVAHWHF